MLSIGMKCKVGKEKKEAVLIIADRLVKGKSIREKRVFAMEGLPIIFSGAAFSPGLPKEIFEGIEAFMNAEYGQKPFMCTDLIAGKFGITAIISNIRKGLRRVHETYDFLLGASDYEGRVVLYRFKYGETPERVDLVPGYGIIGYQNRGSEIFLNELYSTEIRLGPAVQLASSMFSLVAKVDSLVSEEYDIYLTYNGWAAPLLETKKFRNVTLNDINKAKERTGILIKLWQLCGKFPGLELELERLISSKKARKRVKGRKK